MIRTIFTPETRQITLPIPDTYIGKALELIIVPVTEINTAVVYPPRTPVFGCAKGKFKVSEDFDAPLEDFMEYTH
jgi:hypothetical protein